jgi:hypothetical protein
MALTVVAMAYASLSSMAIVLLTLNGLGWPTLLEQHWAVVLPLLIVGPALYLLERRIHRPEWSRWRQHMDDCSLADVLALRHIPDWRRHRA